MSQPKSEKALAIFVGILAFLTLFPLMGMAWIAMWRELIHLWGSR